MMMSWAIVVFFDLDLFSFFKQIDFDFSLEITQQIERYLLYIFFLTY